MAALAFGALRSFNLQCQRIVLSFPQRNASENGEADILGTFKESDEKRPQNDENVRSAASLDM